MISWIKHEYISSSEDEINIRLTDLVATKRTLVTIKSICFKDIDNDCSYTMKRTLEKNESLCIRGLNHSEIIVLNDYPSKYYYNTDYSEYFEDYGLDQCINENELGNDDCCDVDINANYKLKMSIEEVDRIGRVSLKFIPEAELGAIIFPHL